MPYRATLPALLLACLLGLPTPAGAQAPARSGIPGLVARLEQLLLTGDSQGYLQLITQSADRRRAEQFARENIGGPATRVVVRERDRGDLEGTLPGNGYQLLLEVFVETGQKARLVTWGLDVRKRGGTEDEWGIAEQRTLTTLGGLYRLALNPSRAFSARNLVITAEDLQLTLESGSVFVAETDGGITALVLLGKGEMSFTPGPKVEREQVRLFAGSEGLASPFEVAFVRVNPFSLDAHLDRRALVERPVDPREFKRADEVFRQEVVRSFGLDLAELSSESWSLLPASDDFLAEVRTRRFDTLTYSRAGAEVEDISVFDRKNHRNLTVYSSKSHLEKYTRFFDEDDQAEFSVSQYDVDLSFDPSRLWIQGRARLAVLTRAPTGTNSLTIRLADPLEVRSVVSNEYGRLLFVRVRNHNAIVVNLPGTFTSGVRLTLTIDYAGVLPPQPIDREVLAQVPQYEEQTDLPMESSFLYSTRSYWYPQAPSLNYAPARVRIAVPISFSCAASGELMSVTNVASGRNSPRQYTFVATQPLRYLAFLVTPLVDVSAVTLRLGSVMAATFPTRLSGVFYDDMQLVTRSSPRLRGRARGIAKTAEDVVRFFTSIVGDFPYPTLTLAVVERQLPGGHSPGYLSVLAQPAPGSRLRVADDPASFTDFPEFFVAHEIAHQWWGQAIGWKNYHEQWLSEGFAQYFAALYAEHARGRPVFDSMMVRMRNWAEEKSDQGPVYLGYRVGHVKNDGRVFRAIVYDKGAVVLHMLRELVGDRAFFRGVRHFYELWRFEKAGTDDFRKSMEAESGLSLARFFERWIYAQDLPQLALTWRVEQDGKGSEVVLRVEQQGEIFDVPVVVTLDYADKPASVVLVQAKDKVTEVRVPLAGTLRKADIVRDRTLAVIRQEPPPSRAARARGPERR